MKHLLFLSIGLALAGGCGSSGKTSAHQRVERLRLAPFSAVALDFGERFYAFGKRSQRLSQIDPRLGVELWGEQIACCFDSSMALPGRDGAALLGPSGLLIAERGGGRTSFSGFAVEGSLVPAREHPTFASLDGAGTRVRVVRWLASGAWQDETLLVAESDRELEGESSGVAAVAGDGRTLVLLGPSSGRLVTFGPVADGAPLGGTPRRCGPFGGNDYRALAVSRDGARLWLGDQSSRVQLVALAGCEGGDAVTEVVLDAGTPVTSLDPQADGSLLVALASGMIHALDGGTLATIGTYGPVCEHPAGIAAPAPGLLVATCYETEEGTSGAAQVVYSKSYVRLVFRDENAFGPLIQRRDRGVAGSIADGTTQSFHVLLDNALGVLETTGLATGDQGRRRGLFLPGLLD